VGRAVEVEVIRRKAARVVSGHGEVLLFEGEPGIGKSALLKALCEAASERGCAVFRGAGDELGQAFPLLPLLDAFAIAESSDDWRRVEVAQLLAAGSSAGAEAVAAAVERLLSLVDQLCAQTPAVLVVDDLHWADTATVSVWHRLARSARRRQLLLVGAMRPLRRRTDLAALRRAVDRASAITLGALPNDAVRDLAAATAGGRPGPGLLRMAERATGNPLYLTELVAALGRAERLRVSEGTVEATGEPSATTLREVIGDRLSFLPDDAREVLRAAALLGTEFDVAELAAVLARRPADLLGALREARTAGVLTESRGSLAFRHELIRGALYTELPPSERAAWHADAARALYEAGAPAERVARQLLAAVADGGVGVPLDDGWAVEWLMANAPMLVDTAAEVAVRLLRPTLRRLSLGDARYQALADHLSRALADRAEYDEAERLITQTLPYVAKPDVLVDLYDTLARIRAATLSRVDETLAELERTLAANPGLPAGSRNRLQVIRVRLSHSRGDLDGAERIGWPALADATERADRWAMARLLSTLAAVTAWRGELVKSLELFEQGLVVSRDEPGLTDMRLMLLTNQAMVEMTVDRPRQARATLAEAERLAERSGKVRRLRQVYQTLCRLHFQTGHWDDALSAATVLDTAEVTVVEAAKLGIAAVITFHRGDAGAARRYVQATRGFIDRVGPNELGPWVAAHALDREVAADPRAALAVLVDGLEHGPAGRRPETELWLADCARLAVELGERETATRVGAQAERLAQAGDVPTRQATALHCQGLVAADPAQLLAAAGIYEQLGRPLPRAQALESAGLLLAERGRKAEARDALAGALAGYGALGASWDIARVRASLRDRGLRVTRSQARPATGWAALTKTEAKVAELLADGLSNPEIAVRLGSSPRTVEIHVSRILAKLQVRSRIDVARIAASSRRS